MTGVPGRKYGEADTPPDELGDLTGHKHQIIVDWDGTCVIPAWPEQPIEWMPGAVKALHDMASYANVLISSARLNQMDPWTKEIRPAEVVQSEYDYIRRMLDREGLHHVGIWNEHGKPSGDLYIDDKGERYNGRKHSWARIAQKTRLRFAQPNGYFPPWTEEEHGDRSE